MTRRRKVLLYVGAILLCFPALVPISWHVADAYFFTHPYDQRLFSPVLLVCAEHIVSVRLQEAKQERAQQPGNCTFQISPARQQWVEASVRRMPSPNPKKSSWSVTVKQMGERDQKIDLRLVGDGVAGLIYEVKDGVLIPLKTRLTGPAGILLVLVIQLCLWLLACLLVWKLFKWLMPAKVTQVRAA